MAANFQLSLPYVLLPVSPGLAALHASRFRRLNPSEAVKLDSSHCSKCGFFLMTGDGEIRMGRKGKRAGRVMQRTCRICGHKDGVHFDRGNAALFPMSRKARGVVPVEQTSTIVAGPSSAIQSLPMNSVSNARSAAPSHPTTPSEPSSGRASPIPPPTTSDPPVRIKARPKKKSGLQHMLARNREKEEQARMERQDGQSPGLSAFLSGL